MCACARMNDCQPAAHFGVCQQSASWHAALPQCGQAAVEKLFGVSVYELWAYFQFELRDRVITLSGRWLPFTICL